jgi:two-component system, OmpR family, alkaline phosphatase synthesis response regulator PhoP
MNLELVGHTSEQNYDGHEALLCLKNSTYSLILMDIMLPGLDGFNLIQHVDHGTPVLKK